MASPLLDSTQPVGSARYGLYVDADNSSNPEIKNKRKAMYAFVFGYVRGSSIAAASGKRCPKISPVIANSKSIGMAATSHWQHYVGSGSGENEIYGLAHACDESLAFSYMMEQKGQDSPLPAILRCDAKTAEVFFMSPAQRSRMGADFQR